MTLTATQPSLLESYRRGDLAAFHRLAPGDLAGALEGDHPSDRMDVSAALVATNRRLGAPQAALDAAERLAHPAARVVVTGQQAGLLGGPAFTFYKAATTILLARQLDREDRPVVPLFWVASQDHDAAEIASTHLLDLEETLHSLSLPLPSGRPVGKLGLEPAWVERTLVSLEAFAGPPEWRQWVRERVQRAADGARSPAAWFARLIAELLGPQGLVVLDPLEPELARLFEPMICRELESPLAGSHAIEDAAWRLEALGHAPQLRRPAGATNLFLEGADGHRRLLRFDGRRYHAESTTFSREDLEAIARLDPSRLTPAAGLRPVFQDRLLPTAVSVLGPSELAYQLQLAGVYAHHDAPQPLLWPRMSVTWLEAPVRRILGRYGLDASAVAADPQGSLERVALERSGAADAFRSGLVDLELAFERLASTLDQLDPTLEGALLRSRSRVVGHVSRLERKVAAAAARNENEAEHQFERLTRHLRPRGLPQERGLGFLTYLLKYGPEPLERLMTLEPTGSHWLEI